MNIYEWVLSAAVVLLWLYALSVKHSVTVVDEALKRESARRVEINGILLKNNHSLWEEVGKKQDAPLLRRKTDKKPDDEWTICCKPPKKVKR